MFGLCHFLPEPHDLELRVTAGLIGDVTGDGEILGHAPIQLQLILFNGQVIFCKKKKKEKKEKNKKK